jgi:dTDP-4-amino-4,6-dideoxygalactose transaminase
VIPLVDLKAQYQAHKDEFDRALFDCIGNTRFIGGADHAGFETELAEFLGGGHVALTSCGTHALALTLSELLGPGNGTEEVITVSHTFIATVEAIVLAGYKPVFVDIDPVTYCMDVGALAAAVTARTRAIMPVHLYGQMADMDGIMAVAQRHGLVVVEDAAQAHGAAWNGKQAGLTSHAACVSFSPAKNLGAWGDGGAVFTRDGDLAAKLRKTVDHARLSKYEHGYLATNSRLDGLQAAILRVKLRHLPVWTRARQERADWYRDLLADCDGVQLPVCAEAAVHVYHLFVIQVDRRDEVLKTLNHNGVGAGIHYPIPAHEQPACRHLGYAAGDLPVTHEVSQRIISLPLFPELSRDQAETVARAVRSAVTA